MRRSCWPSDHKETFDPVWSLVFENYIRGPVNEARGAGNEIKNYKLNSVKGRVEMIYPSLDGKSPWYGHLMIRCWSFGHSQDHSWHDGVNSMKLVILLHSLYWSIHIKDENKRGTAFTFIFGVNWLWRCGVTASFGVFFHEIKCNRMTSFMEFHRVTLKSHK